MLIMKNHNVYQAGGVVHQIAQAEDDAKLKALLREKFGLIFPCIFHPIFVPL